MATSRKKTDGKDDAKIVQMPAAPEPEEFSLDDPSLYFNRELSLLEFQRRVLDEARDERNKLLERVKFLSIVSSNLDEFFMVRNAALKQKLRAGNQDLSIDGKTVTQQLSAVRTRVGGLMKEDLRLLSEAIDPGTGARRHSHCDVGFAR